MTKMLGAGAGIIFRGSGFYETDYKKSGGDSKEKGDSAAKTEGKGEGKAETKSDAKSEAKAEAKSEAKTDSTASKPTADKPKAKTKD
jgi:hypothetical protein